MSTTNTALLIPADINAACKSVQIPDRDLFEVSKIIGCEYVGRVNVLSIIREGIGMNTDVWVDDCGLLNDSPVNVRASIITGQRIVGNVVITGCTNKGDLCDLKFKSCVREFLDILNKTAQDWIANGYPMGRVH